MRSRMSCNDAQWLAEPKARNCSLVSCISSLTCFILHHHTIAEEFVAQFLLIEQGEVFVQLNHFKRCAVCSQSVHKRFHVV